MVPRARGRCSSACALALALAPSQARTRHHCRHRLPDLPTLLAAQYDSAPAAALPPDQDMMQLLFKVSELLGSVPELLPLSNRLKLFLLKVHASTSVYLK